MCQSVRVRLAPSQRATIKKWYGVIIPIYASIGLFILGGLIFTQGPRSPEPTAVARAVDR